MIEYFFHQFFLSIIPALTPTRRNEISGFSVFSTNIKLFGSNFSLTILMDYNKNWSHNILQFNH